MTFICLGGLVFTTTFQIESFTLLLICAALAGFNACFNLIYLNLTIFQILVATYCIIVAKNDVCFTFSQAVLLEIFLRVLPSGFSHNWSGLVGSKATKPSASIIRVSKEFKSCSYYFPNLSISLNITFDFLCKSDIFDLLFSIKASLKRRTNLYRFVYLIGPGLYIRIVVLKGALFALVSRHAFAIKTIQIISAFTLLYKCCFCWVESSVLCSDDGIETFCSRSRRRG